MSCGYGAVYKIGDIMYTDIGKWIVIGFLPDIQLIDLVTKSDSVGSGVEIKDIEIHEKFTAFNLHVLEALNIFTTCIFIFCKYTHSGNHAKFFV